MRNLILRHFLQVFFTPSAGVTLAWYGHIASDVLPKLQLIEWAVLGILFIVIVEMIAYRAKSGIALSVISLLQVAVIAGIPAYFFFVRFPVNYAGVFDHGGLILSFFLVAAFTARWRIYRAGYTALDIIEAQGNLPKGSLSKALKKISDDE